MFEQWAAERSHPENGSAPSGAFEREMQAVISSPRTTAGRPRAGTGVFEPEVIKKGSLNKLGGFRFWKRKWVVLDVKCLSFFGQREDTTPEGRVLLSDISRVLKVLAC